jgi:hypothetical protein
MTMPLAANLSRSSLLQVAGRGIIDAAEFVSLIFKENRCREERRRTGQTTAELRIWRKARLEPCFPLYINYYGGLRTTLRLYPATTASAGSRHATHRWLKELLRKERWEGEEGEICRR